MNISTEYGPIEIDYDPSSYKTPHAAAKGMYKALRKLCAELGMDPNHEVFLCTPDHSEYMGTGRNWRVVWESGPFEWAVGASFECENNPYWFTEPYYSFDLCFVPG